MDASSYTACIDTSVTGAVSRALLDWYDGHARDLPWRAPPGLPAPDPYRVWLSEVMLQQTTVGAVKAYFAAFTARWPTVHDLAAAPDAEVMAAWAGLGYYARARNLVACARAVAANGGAFPDTEEGLRALPGLGAYTAAAVAAIAFGRRAVVVDANVERVVTRLFALETPLPGARPSIRELADTITPDDRAGDFAQAMMDLGATICTSRSPRCLLCPLSFACEGRATGEPQRFPVKAAKKAKPLRQGRAFWIERNFSGADQVWLVQRVGSGMLGGMRALPDDGWAARADGSGEEPLPGPWESAGIVAHVFTHFSLALQVAVYLGDRFAVLDEQPGEWWPLDRLDEAGLPTLFAKAAQLALAGKDHG
ncbi:A/G-specific adenine glycosylase [Novosphingobium sp. Rr 2-17]|uniref:A/G-specific adenine glycosylase n=1 Tax=Novosphingobium sp. Rr 2-17 TaxID=555793 RepID=UPI000269A819|nr:A/G-specific adenine glycosylase [Novosphingobium sp. Rr 2-17]EIZ78870.1 A/G-specific adenine glycosylase [Novosphingobium sp. Rr 2-17]